MKAHCRCPSPPGGSVTCDTHQVAYCKVVGGETFSGCLTPPAEEAYAIHDPERRLRALLRWVLMEIEFSTLPGDFEVEAMQDLFGVPDGYSQWLDQIQAGAPLQLEGWAWVDGVIQRSQVTIRVPEQYGDPRQVHEYGYAPA
ncbi:hypothetical protein LVB77_03645 [Lysobacter sp. 5GHs7-4]|uniref:hypothetical protein n=1 Tax=Lysobacter sp. 5GHs7-4 TaxID=2904253 RepID=UPI001E36DDE0|nr:hypothetical protein [Lysobacter sp. 5GHs7-4]UHQ23816.1 hypothetical protein LVB77_03645 [Lysobacter sp. 5GHs7-4]